MHKKILLLFFSFILVFNLTSCNERLALDKNLRNVIEYADGENGVEGIYYQNSLYHLDKWEIFRVTDNMYEAYKNDILLSWDGLRLGYMHTFYSYTENSPLFIYDTSLNRIFFHETYDYTSDTFVIDGIEAEIVFFDMVGDLSKHKDVTFQEDICITLYSKSHSRIKTKLYLECIDNQWYISFALPHSGVIGAASDTFVQLLTENGII